MACVSKHSCITPTDGTMPTWTGQGLRFIFYAPMSNKHDAAFENAGALQDQTGSDSLGISVGDLHTSGII